MITVFLINMNAEVIIRHYETSSEEDACRLLVTDWQEGKINWEYENTNEAFTKEFLDELLDLELTSFSPQYQNGVRFMEWYCGGENKSNDEIVWIYFIHPDTSKLNFETLK